MFIYLPDPPNEDEDYRVKTNVTEETGYLGDVDTSSSESSEPQSPDSEDGTLTTLRKGSMLKPELKPVFYIHFSYVSVLI